MSQLSCSNLCVVCQGEVERNCGETTAAPNAQTSANHLPTSARQQANLGKATTHKLTGASSDFDMICFPRERVGVTLGAGAGVGWDRHGGGGIGAGLRLEHVPRWTFSSGRVFRFRFAHTLSLEMARLLRCARLFQFDTARSFVKAKQGGRQRERGPAFPKQWLDQGVKLPVQCDLANGCPLQSY